MLEKNNVNTEKLLWAKFSFLVFILESRNARHLFNLWTINSLILIVIQLESSCSSAWNVALLSCKMNFPWFNTVNIVNGNKKFKVLFYAFNSISSSLTNNSLVFCFYFNHLWHATNIVILHLNNPEYTPYN